MSLPPGLRIGFYEVVAPIGRGGMGEVYRARDTKLGRDVAIKILPAALRDDREHIDRLEREARVLASLNHPNIGTILGFEEAEGLRAVVMELVEGETLAERLARGPLPAGEAVDVARQIALALDAAHAQGIAHRDLKPANVKRRPDGTVKVLDFGLARPLSTHADTPTVTETSSIAGTPAYMSPEQARGEPVSGQADIWSFGVVLFELVSGVSPFARRSTAETLAAVLADAPDYDRLPKDTPPAVRRLIRRCLERDLRRRLQHIGDARIELEEALTSATDGSLDRLAGAASGPARTSRRLLSAALAIAALVAGLAIGALWLAPRPAALQVVRTTIPAEITFGGTDRSLAFIPGSNRIAYVGGAGSQILVRPLDRLDPTAILTSAAVVRGLSASPDGRWLSYVENAFTLRKVSTAGGPSSTVLVMDGPSRGVAWGPDDTIVFATGAPDTGLQQVASGGGAVTVLTRPDRQHGEADHMQPEWLPGGRALLFTVVPERGGLDAARVAALDVSTGTTRTVIEGGHAARYVDSGHLLYAAAGALWAVRFDASALDVRGAPIEVLSSVTIGRSGASADFDASGDGALAYARGAVSPDRLMLTWVDRDGRETPLAVPADNYIHPRISPDGRRLAVGVQGDIHIWEFSGPWSAASRLTVDPALDWFPVWTPDARRIIFGSWRGGRFSNLYAQGLDSSSANRLTDSPDMEQPTSISPDGATVVFHSVTKSLQALRLGMPGRGMTLVETPGEERNGEVSPDGRWLAYEGESLSRPGQIDVYVRPFPDVDRGLWQVTSDGGMYPVWSRNGRRELFYAALDGTMVAVPIESVGTTWRTGSPAPLFRGQYVIREGTLGRQYDVAPDGRFLMVKFEETRHAPHIVLVQNWLAELGERLR